MIPLLLSALSAPPAAAADLDLPAAYSVAAPADGSAEVWWRALGDPTLEGLVDEALTGNGDLAAAWGQVLQSRGGATQSLAGLTPTVSFDVTDTVAPTESLGFQFGGFGAQYEAETYQINSAAFNAAMSLDIWGRNVNAWRASRYSAMATEGDAEAQALALVTNVIEGWYDLLTARSFLEIAQTQAQANEELLELMELRYARGEIAALDLLQQRQLVASARTLTPRARLQLRGAEQRLAVMLGRSPVSPELPGGALPDALPSPDVGAPSDLLETRPDLRAAVARYDASVAGRKSAARAFLPALSLSGQYGWQGTYFEPFDAATYFDDLNTQQYWNLTARLSVPIFSGGVNVGALQAASAGEDAALRALEQAALRATQEVEFALIQESEQRALLDAYRTQREAARLAYEESRSQYLLGLTPYVNVLNALNSWQQAEQGALQAQRDMLSARVQLHDALGGSWTRDLLAD